MTSEKIIGKNEINNNKENKLKSEEIITNAETLVAVHTHTHTHTHK